MESDTNPPVSNRGALETVWYQDLQAQISLFAVPVGPGFLLVHTVPSFMRMECVSSSWTVKALTLFSFPPSSQT